MIHYNYTVTKVTHDDFKVGDVYICDNEKEVLLSSLNMKKEVTLCLCNKLSNNSDDDFVDFTDFKLLEGESHYGKDEKLSDWLYQKSDCEFYDFYLVSREIHPEEYL